MLGVVTWGACLVTAVLLGLGLTFSLLEGRHRNPAELTSEIAIVGVLLAAAVGALISTRRPGNRIGLLLLVFAVSTSAKEAAVSYAYYALSPAHELPGAAWAAWIAIWVDGPALVAMLLVLLLYPTGRPPSPRLRAVGWLILAWGVLGLTGALDPRVGLPDGRLLPNPTGGLTGGDKVTGAVVWVVIPLFFALTLGLAGGIIVRFHRARGIERAQMKWLAYAAALGLATLLVPNRWLGDWKQTVVDLVVAVGLPVAIGIAILRYRLYDVDRLINRTLVYGLLTALLAGVYSVAVLVLGQVFGGVGGDPPSWVVAGATLAVAAVFQPARRRIQRAVDRRFNRHRYDATKTVEAFSVRLRDQFDLEALTSELLAVVSQTVEPRTASLWLRAQPDRPGPDTNHGGAHPQARPALDRDPAGHRPQATVGGG
jgi:hypothetical protein